MCSAERSQTTFLAPDGFVQTPWKPHTPQINQRSSSSPEEEQTLTATLGRFYKLSAIWFQSHLPPFYPFCSLFLVSYVLLFVQTECNISKKSFSVCVCLSLECFNLTEIYGAQEPNAKNKEQTCFLVFQSTTMCQDFSKTPDSPKY